MRSPADFAHQIQPILIQLETARNLEAKHQHSDAHAALAEQTQHRVQKLVSAIQTELAGLQIALKPENAKAAQAAIAQGMKEAREKVLSKVEDLGRAVTLTYPSLINNAEETAEFLRRRLASLKAVTSNLKQIASEKRPQFQAAGGTKELIAQLRELKLSLQLERHAMETQLSSIDAQAQGVRLSRLEEEFLALSGEADRLRTIVLDSLFDSKKKAEEIADASLAKRIAAIEHECSAMRRVRTSQI